eukprot:656741-Rhodomonas_salina.2
MEGGARRRERGTDGRKGARGLLETRREQGSNRCGRPSWSHGTLPLALLQGPSLPAATAQNVADHHGLLLRFKWMTARMAGACLQAPG